MKPLKQSLARLDVSLNGTMIEWLGHSVMAIYRIVYMHKVNLCDRIICT